MKQKHISSEVFRVTTITDTITLPFVDDFSRPGMYPFDSLWLDSGVYVNTSHSGQPFTIGMATFDGLNQYGAPYHPGATSDSIADYLTSRPIDLAYTPGDTTIWFSFYYEPQGLGDAPETQDSLVLQFKDTGGVWNKVWGIPGTGVTSYTRVAIQIDSTKYFFKGFQFRFYNIATVNGDRDHWNLDYVALKHGSVATDSVQDNAMLRPLTTLLNEYTAMPYSHYKSLPSQQAAMIDMIRDTISNIRYGITTYTARASVLQNGSLLYNFSPLTIPISASNILIPDSFTVNPFFYPVQPTDSADFLFKSYIDPADSSSNRYNDTSFLVQRFHNYYAYDDGSAEMNYTLTGSFNVSFAYRFDVKMTDTLRGVQIYFEPTGEQIANELFQLTVWNSIDEVTNNDSITYRMINQKPGTFDGINAFKTYLFDTTIVLNPGPVYIGVIQNDPQARMGYGFDMNTDNHSKLLYRVAGDWLTSNIQGTVMIRPFFGAYVPGVGIEDIAYTPLDFSIYPNPTDESFRIQFENEYGNDLDLKILNCLGEIVLEKSKLNSKEINTADLSPGIYFVRIENNKNHSSAVRKLIVK
jgi:hypothetical protein